VKALGRIEAAAIYRARYWDAVRGDDLPPGVDLLAFDCAVHAGPDRAIRLMQGVLGVAMDGVIGAKTLAGLRAASAAPLAKRLIAARCAFLKGLPGWAHFGRGWERRLRGLEREALRLLRAPDAPLSLLETKGQSPMLDHGKSMLASRTIWANLVGFAAIVLSAFGIETGSVDQTALVDAILAMIAAGSFIASTLFRVLATRKLG
jgi:lysozyme family protein